MFAYSLGIFKLCTKMKTLFSPSYLFLYLPKKTTPYLEGKCATTSLVQDISFFCTVENATIVIQEMLKSEDTSYRRQ